MDSLAFGEITFVHYGKPETNLWRVSSVVLELVFIGYGYVEVEGIPTGGSWRQVIAYWCLSA